MPQENPPVELEQSLCLDCGLCCKGVTLSGVRLTAIERQNAPRLRLTVIDTPRGSAFALPCPNLSGNSCEIYVDRPRACADYRCKLLEGVRDQSLTLADAGTRIRELLDLLRVIEGIVTPAKMPEFLRLAAHAADPQTPPEIRSQLVTAMGEARSFWLTLRSLLNDWVHAPAELKQRLDRDAET